MYDVVKFNLGRECLKYLVNKYRIEQMHIPYYLCDVVRHILVENGCKPIFYHIDDNFYPANKFPAEDYVLYPNYFGIFSENVKRLSTIYSKLIVDNAHAYYDIPQGFACFNAGHKFGYEKSTLWINPGNIENIKVEGNRKENFLKLHSTYSCSNLLNIDTENIYAPYVYPYLAESTEKADKLVKELESQGKIIFRYWNPLPQSFNEYKFYSRLVPIPLG